MATRIDDRRRRTPAAGELPHLDDLGRVDEGHAGGTSPAVLVNLALEARNVADQDDLVGVGGGVVDCPPDDLARRKIAAHRVDRDAHRADRQRPDSVGVGAGGGTTSRPLCQPQFGHTVWARFSS